MVAKDYQKTKGSNKAEVGEIDTSSPFQSVKDAVSLFGEGAFSGEKKKPAINKSPKPQSAEKVLAKETQLHLTQKQLNKLKEQLKYAETTKVEALLELEKAKRTVEDLTIKLKTINESKDSAIRSAQVAKQFVEANNDHSKETDKETARVQYMSAVTELDAAKQELTRIRQEYGANMESKDSAEKLEAEARKAAKANMGKVGELSKEISNVQDSIQLGETLWGIEALKIEMGGKIAADLDSVKNVTLELDGAKESLSRVAGEESSLRSLVESLKLEMDNIRKEHSDLKEKEVETESIAGNLHVKLRKAKSELAEEAKVRGASDEMIATVHQLTSESENAKHEALEMKQRAEELKRETEATRIELEEAENKLKAASQEAEEAKAAEVRVLDQIKSLSEKTDASRSSVSAQITLSREEFESLSRKVEESGKLAEMKVAAAMAQVEAVKASENEAFKKFEAMQKEIEDMKNATREALKKAEMAEAAKKAVEGELRRWREREQKKAAETASRILAESDYHQIQKQKPQEKVIGTRKLEKAKTYVAAKKVLMPSLSSVFRKKKKNKVEGGSPSYLPGEEPVW